jgi:hypothetical protein
MAQVAPGYFICTTNDMHPYNCGGPNGEDMEGGHDGPLVVAPCVHCNRKTTPWHKVTKCAFCRSDKAEARR